MPPQPPVPMMMRQPQVLPQPPVPLLKGLDTAQAILVLH